MCRRTSRSGRLHCEFLVILQFDIILDILHCEFPDILQFGTFLDILQADEEKTIFICTTNKLLCMLELYFMVVPMYV